MVRRISNSEIATVRRAIYDQQNGRCPLCTLAFPFSNATLDHDHVTGQVRGVLCRMCNRAEGKIKNAARSAAKGHKVKDYTGRVIMYWLKHEVNVTGLLHPLHRTDDEKRELRNKRAREARARKKAAK